MASVENPGRDVVARFFLTADISGFLEPLNEALTTLSSSVQPIGRAFRQNLHGALSTLDIPLTLAFAGAKQERLHRLYLANLFRAKAELARTERASQVDADVPEAYQLRAMDQAQQTLQSELESEDGLHALSHVTASVLSKALESEDVRAAADELLRQGAVLLWSSFEVLCRDLIVAFLNARPQQLLKLVETPATRRFLNLRGLDLDILAEHGFNVSDKIGTILASRYDLGSLGILKEMFASTLSTGERAREVLSTKSLWILQQRRHLIVHQRAVVDDSYLRSTGESTETGRQLRVAPTDVTTYMFVARDSGMSLLRMVSDELPSV